MKLFVLALLLSFYSNQTKAAPAWEVCLDNADFTLSVNDSFLNFVKLAKSGCTLRFLTIGGKGEKLEINLCDANIHVDQFAAIDATEHTSQYAGSAGCPAPMFGADFNERAEDLHKYDAAKGRLKEILEMVNKSYGKNAVKFDLNNLKPSDLNSSEGKTACANYMVKQYLDNCTAFEEKKSQVKEVTPVLIPTGDLPPGVHPAIIRK
ncbi:MAG: hypothetical protein ACXWQO_12460 [Bdellovibrionota bacterium]